MNYPDLINELKEIESIKCDAHLKAILQLWAIINNAEQNGLSYKEFKEKIKNGI